MKFEHVEVATRDEYKGAQEPVSFEWRERHYDVAQIVDRWYEGHIDSTRMPLVYFRVRTTESEQFILRYHELFRAWGLLVPDRETDARVEGP
jgi:hypothetical protein